MWLDHKPKRTEGIVCIPLNALLKSGVREGYLMETILFSMTCSSPALSTGSHQKTEKDVRGQMEQEMCSQHLDCTELHISAHFCNPSTAPKQGSLVLQDLGVSVMCALVQCKPQIIQCIMTRAKKPAYQFRRTWGNWLKKFCWIFKVVLRWEFG